MKKLRGKISENQEEQPSRSAKKRESAALQKLGEELTQLSPADREEMNLPEELLEALKLHDRIGDHEGARRQRQYIGKIMRQVDAASIGRALAARRALKGDADRRFHVAENWRERLLTAPENSLDQTLAEFFSSMPAATAEESEKLRSCVARARADNPSAVREKRQLFRLIREIML